MRSQGGRCVARAENGQGSQLKCAFARARLQAPSLLLWHPSVVAHRTPPFHTCSRLRKHCMSTALYVKLSHSSAVWHAIMQSCGLGWGGSAHMLL